VADGWRCPFAYVQAFADEAKTVGAAKKAKRAADKAARSPDDVQLTLFQKASAPQHAY